MSTPRHAMFHLRRHLRQQPQEVRRAQREMVANAVAAMDRFADQMAAQHQAFVQQQQADQQRLITEAEGPAEQLDALRKQLH